MKVSNAEKHVVGSRGLQETKTFNIRTTPHAFKMLSSGLYTDKVGAVLREIACNAMDAHVDIGTPDRPIEVKLPNAIDTQFFIRDWGKGLSHDDVMHLYTSYFASTKQTSNDFTGAFGLGSKSPFSYTDSFTITSVFEGTKRIYSAHLDDTGSPTISLMGESVNDDKDWEHGVCIGFPVKPEDFIEFKTKAHDIYKWFRVTPIIRGGEPVAPVSFAYTSKDGRLSLLPVNIRNTSKVSLVMGNVMYPIMYSEMSPHLADVGRRLFSINGIVIRVNIGDVQVAASREGLQYDKDTVAFLVTYIESVMTDLANEVAHQIRTVYKLAWKDRCTAQNLLGTWDKVSNYSTWTDAFAALKMPDAKELGAALRHRDVPLGEEVGSRALVRTFSVTELSNGQKNVSHRVIRDGEIRLSQHNKTNAHLRLIPETVIIYGQASHALARVRAAMIKTNSEIKQAILVMAEPDTATKATDKAKAVKWEVDRLKARFKGMEVIDISTLPVPSWAAKSGKSKGKSKTATTSNTPLPSMPVVMYNAALCTEKVVDAAGLDPATDHFMVKTADWGDHYSANIREYKVSLEKDRRFTSNSWKAFNSSICVIGEEIDIPSPTTHLLLTAAEARMIGVAKRGWVSTREKHLLWLTSKEVQDGMTAAVANWEPSVRLVPPSSANNWTEFLVVLYLQDRAKFLDYLGDKLDKKKYLDGIEAIAKASKKMGKNAGSDTPRVLAAYTNLRAMGLVLPDLGTPTTRAYLSPHDMENTMADSFPLMRVHGVVQASEVYQRAPERIYDFLNYVIS